MSHFKMRKRGVQPPDKWRSLLALMLLLVVGLVAVVMNGDASRLSKEGPIARQINLATGGGFGSASANVGNVQQHVPASTTYPNGVTVTENVAHGTSPAVRDLPDVAPSVHGGEENESKPPEIYRHKSFPKDTVVQREFGALSMPPVITSFEGLNSTDSGCLCTPPDTNGDIGPNDYVQTVNSAFRVYDKNGTPRTAVRQVSSLFVTLAGSLCATPGINYSDPVVLYDTMADRWMISELVYAAQGIPSEQCIAVSQTPDPTGAYYTYAFEMSTSLLADYPKYGIWPDGYYLTSNNFAVLPQQSYNGPSAIVLDRARMLQGQSATAQQYNLSPLFFSLLPSNLEGHNPPPAGAPNYFVSASGSDADLYLWKFHTDWANPSNTSFIGPTFLPVAPFDPELCDYGDCVPQPNTTARLDTIGNHLMYTLAYRNFGDHESLVSNETVDADVDHAAIRWYELRDPGGVPQVYQQGTYAPDATNRWLGSSTMDGSGNMAIGYSASSSVISPSLRLAGRLAGDPLGQLTQGETVLHQGQGVQTGSPGRWGDYSSLALDPSDDCTFWYTNEYYATTSGNAWHTRIGSFKFAGCTQAPPVATSTPGTATPVATATAGPACNYTVMTTTGTLMPGTLDIGNHCDDCTTAITLPFSLRLYGQSFTSANVSSNGNLQFSSAYFSGQGQCLPVETLVNAIAAYWTDLVTTGTNKGVFTSVTGVAPNRIFNVEWRSSPFGSQTNLNFEIRLYEGQDTFDIVYGPDFTDAGAAVVGVQRDLYQYTNYECNAANARANTVVTFTLPPCGGATATATVAATQTSALPSATRTRTSVPASATATSALPTGTNTVESTQTPGGATVTSVPTSTVCPLSFTDVPADSTFYPFIRCLACRGVISGYADGTFRPGNDITRGQIAKMVSNAAGFSEDAGPQLYEDVNSANTFYVWINRLSNRGFMGGYPCGTLPAEPCISPSNMPYFRPFANTTRGQLAKIVSNAAEVTGDPMGLYYTDVPEDNPFYLWIMRLTNIGVMSGYDCGRPGEACDDQQRPYFRPFANVTRGQASKIVANAFFPNCETPQR